MTSAALLAELQKNDQPRKGKKVRRRGKHFETWKFRTVENPGVILCPPSTIKIVVDKGWALYSQI